MSEAPPMIDVDADGFDKDGFDYVYDAAPEAIEAGLVVSRPVRLRYPNGEVILATEVLITKKGLARLASQEPKA